MKVILLNNIKKIGSRFDVIDVADGFAQNFLIPQKKALPATPENLGNIESIKMNQAEAIAQERHEIEAIIKGLKDTVLKHTAPANEQGGLYESVTASTISDLLEEQANIDLNDMYIVLDSPIKKTGEYEITCAYEDITGTVKVVITGEEVK